MLSTSYVEGWPTQWLGMQREGKKEMYPLFWKKKQKNSCHEAQQSVVNNTGRNVNGLLVCAPWNIFLLFGKMPSRRWGALAINSGKSAGRSRNTLFFLHAYVQVLVVCVRISQWLYQTLNLIHFLIISKTGREKPSVGLPRQKSHYNARN